MEGEVYMSSEVNIKKIFNIRDNYPKTMHVKFNQNQLKRNGDE